jgi:hypothetical protein
VNLLLRGTIITQQQKDPRKTNPRKKQLFFVSVRRRSSPSNVKMVRISAFVCFIATSSSSAFAPSRPVGTSAFVTTTSKYHRNRIPYTSTSALQMNLFDRFTRVAKANIDSALKSLEDPEKILNQALIDMQV